LFGLLWAAAGTSGLTIPAGVRVTVAIAALLVTGTVVALAFRFGGVDSAGRTRRLPTTWLRDVGRINITQFLAIAAAAVIMGRTGVPALIPVVICLVVGLHFLPLARCFGQPQYLWTGGLLIAVAVSGFVAVGFGATMEPARALVGFGAAAVLWGTAFDVAIRG
jgi:hypothetical protein